MIQFAVSGPMGQGSFLMLKSKLPSTGTKSMYSLGVSLDAGAMIPAKSRDAAHVAIIVSIVEDTAAKTTPHTNSMQATTPSKMPSFQSMITGPATTVTTKAIDYQSSTKDPEKVLVFLQPSNESVKTEWVGVLLRVALLILLLALIWKVLDCIFCRPATGSRSPRSKSSYTINLM
jgi:hypothetical protein